MTNEEKKLRNELMEKLTSVLVGEDVHVDHFEIQDDTDTNPKNDLKDQRGRITLYYSNHNCYGEPVHD